MPGLSILIKGKPKLCTLFFFDIDSLNKYQKGGADISYLLGNKKYLKRLDYTLDELKKINWQIKYN